jgi:hypothetical protein
METTAFIFGMVTMFLLLLSVTSIVGIVKLYQLYKLVDNIQDSIRETERSIYATINENTEYTRREFEATEMWIHNESNEHKKRFDELQSYTDSRFDKLESKFTKMLEDSKSKKLLNEKSF